MKHFVLVFIGGGTGSVLRYCISKYMNNATLAIPYGTWVANCLGCLLIGVLLGLATKNNVLSQSMVLLLATGFCGGFTTFSTFAYENYILLKSGDLIHFMIYTIGSLAIGVLFVFLGIFMIK